MILQPQNSVPLFASDLPRRMTITAAADLLRRAGFVLARDGRRIVVIRLH